MRPMVLFGLAVFAGCITEVDIPLDGDGDGLLSNLEEELGTDPMSADSDNDGFDDGTEYLSGTDPLDMADHPYTGGWPMDGGCGDDYSPSGNEVGDITGGFGGVEQHGENFLSEDFCGKVLLVEYGAFW